MYIYLNFDIIYTYLAVILIIIIKDKAWYE